MKQKYGFIEFENIKEFSTWLDEQKITRTINKLQVHHTYAPAYKNWATDNALRRQNNIRAFHKNTNGWSDIAQHFTIFPDGHIVTGRTLNNTPIGIKKWNTGAICIEIYGNFDVDIMYKEQSEAIIACYALLAKKFNIPIDLSHIRPHVFFTAGGTYLGKYIASKSAKTCPGIGFFGGLDKFESMFLKQVKSFNIESNSYIVRITIDTLNVRSGPGTKYSIKAKLHKGDAYTIVEEKNNWGKLKSGIGWISLNDKYVEVFEKY